MSVKMEFRPLLTHNPTTKKNFTYLAFDSVRSSPVPDHVPVSGDNAGWLHFASLPTFLRRGLLGTVLLPLNRRFRPHVFYGDTPCCKLCLEPFTALLLGLARMTELPLDYLGKDLACPLAWPGSTKNLHDLVPLRICQTLH